MKPLNFELVIEKKSFLNHFSFAKVVGITLLLIAIPTFFILPFFKGKDNYWFFLYFYFTLSLASISGVISFIRYYFKFDYEPTGRFSLFSDHIHVENKGLTEEIKFPDVTVTLYYNSVRNKGFHFVGKDFARSGISEFLVNGQSFKVLVSNENQMEQLKKILSSWYQQNYSISEFTRTAEKNRLVKLELYK